MDEIQLIENGEVAWLVLNRPAQLNAITSTMWVEMGKALRRVDSDAAIKVLVVRGSGTTAFAAGADLGDVERIAADTALTRANMELYAATQRQLAEFRKPTIAMIHGHCIGAGFGIATACDFRCADEQARFGVPAARIGQVYRLEETRRLVMLVGASRAKRLLYTARFMDAATACEIGLVDELCATADLEQRTLELAGQIAAMSQFTVQGMKRIFRAIGDGQVRDDVATGDLFIEALHGDDYREGMTARREKRPPAFPFR